MRVSRQLVALSAMMVVGGAFLPMSQAQAFGQQWRPTVAHAPTQTANFRRVANVPSFRPRVSAASPRYRASRSVKRSQPLMQPMVAMRPMAPPAYRQPAYPQPAYQHTGYAAPNVWSAMPMWSNPFTQMAQAWQYPMPIYPRQFAWRPAEQPWISQRMWPQQRHDRYTRRAPVVDYRARRSLSAVNGSGRAPAWREMRPAVANSRFAAAGPALASYRPVPGRFVQRRQAPAPQIAAADVQRGNWRPDRAAAPGQIAQAGDFRPATYGRTPSSGRMPMQQRVATRQLPGWVTTHRDTDDLLTCDWCSGS